MKNNKVIDVFTTQTSDILTKNWKFILHAFGVLPMVPMACQWRPKFRHWLPSVTIGTNGMPMFTNGYQWFLPLAANLANNLERRQNYQRAKWHHFQDNNQWKWRVDRGKIKEMTTIFSVSVGANTRLSKFKKKIFYFTAAKWISYFMHFIDPYWVPELKLLWRLLILQRYCG